MTDRLLMRATYADLEVRAPAERIIAGIAVPFDEATPINEWGSDYTEIFRLGAFRKTIQERGTRVKALAVHNRELLPVGRASLLREDGPGLYSELKISKTERGDEVLELARDGALDGLSIGFRPIRDRWSDDRSTVERLEVRLDEISVVPFAAYEGAKVAAVRSQSHGIPIETARARLDLLLEGWIE